MGGIVVRTLRGHQTVRVSDIDYIDAQGNYARLVTRDGRFLVREPLTRLEHRLGSRFLRIHRRYIVRIDRITRIERQPRGTYRIQLASGDSVSSGRSYAAEVRRLIRVRSAFSP